MNFCMQVWTSMNGFWSWVYSIISSPTIIAAFLAPYFAISTYLKQQRISRIQRIYYEESLFDQLKHLDTLIELTTENLSYFENAINLILNDFKIGVITAETILSLNKIANKLKMPTRYHSSKREVLINLFKEHGYVLQQWLFKYDKDFSIVD